MKQLHTRFSENMDPRQVLPEYPRPMLVRESYYNLNGLWEYAITGGSRESSSDRPGGRRASASANDDLQTPAPEKYDGQILVPFSPECALSGVNRKVLPGNVLWYRRKLPKLADYETDIISDCVQNKCSVPADAMQQGCCSSFPFGSDDAGYRVLLHFGAVDQHAWVYVNGIFVGEHMGGYLPFSCDITEALHGWRHCCLPASRTESAPASHTAQMAEKDTSEKDIPKENEACLENILTVRVVDVTDTSYHSRGKQKLDPAGMYYTAQSGIWQTVWMEVVPENYIERIAYRPDCDGSKIRIKLYSETDEAVTYTICAPRIDDEVPGNTENVSPALCSHGNTDAADPQNLEDAPSSAAPASTHQPQVLLTGSGVTNHAFSVSLPGFQAWSPEEPYLYDVTFETSRDRVRSYFAMRKCDIQKDADGVPRMYLNNRPYFQTGLLDQGYYPESLYTPPTDEAMTADILSAKALGFNLLRKHAKIEPDRFYYHCDRLGMLVWQDMVNGGSVYKDWYVTYLATAMNQLHIRPGDRFRRLLSRREKAGRDEFSAEARDTVRALGGHPSIVVWVPFNEGWGQFDTLTICSLIKKMDPGRLVDHASGWFDLGGGDIQSIHYYFFDYKFKPEKRRAMALTEYGGYSWSVPGHCTHDEEYGYQKYSDSASLTAAFRRLITDTVLPSVREGLSAVIYTQLTDIESETNGLYTYDRQICKMDAEAVRECNRMMKEAGA